MKTTHPIGAGKHNLSVTITKEQNDAFIALAAQSGMSRNKYIRAILESALIEPPRIKTNTVLSSTRPDEFPEKVRVLLGKAAQKSKTSRR